MRNNRWKWINSASNQCIQSDTIYVTEDGLNHPIFTNIKLGDNNSIPFTETGITRNESFVATEDVLTGASIKILAFDGVTDDSRVAIAEFEAGYNFYADAPAPSSNRMFIALTEGDNCKLENVRPNVMSAFNGTEQGKTILLNAIAYLMGKEITKVKNVNANNLNVFPNPVVNYITVNNIKGQVGYKIYNMNGAVVLKGTTSSTINVASLNSGLYMVVLDNGMCSKFIKK